MIRINLLQEKKKSARVDRGNRVFLVGMAIVGAAVAGVVFLVHLPLTEELAAIRADNDKRQKSIKKLSDDTKEFDVVQARLAAAREQEEAIKRLNNARAVPSWMLSEVANVLTKDHQPTMTPEMALSVVNEANRKYSPGWDPKRLWINSIDEKDGTVTIQGGAQSPTDVTQFAFRLQASVFFPELGGSTITSAQDSASKLNFYSFSVTGKVRY